MAGHGGPRRNGGTAKKRLYALACWIFGKPGQAAQPPEGVLSVICESFGCTPNVAVGLDPRLVLPILEYRLAESAKEMMNSKQADKMTEGQANMLKTLGELLHG